VSHPFYEQLNRVREEHGFDEFVEQQARASMCRGCGGPLWRRGSTSVSG
jgi:hypothetical protein